ncbi:MAG: type II toxin-antitoxin system PemK/MazF family toxin [Chloroflexota bacterium]|nr:type II toxin-antitoxin system PemK/MazF family toxin [Chloroflexota bacterium]
MPKQSVKRRNSKKPYRGEIWLVNFNNPPSAPNPPIGSPQAQLPTTGDEIYKPRPAVVMNIAASWHRQLHIVVPLTTWKERYANNRYFWLVHIPRDKINKLHRDSAADVFQVKSLSIKRFGEKAIGLVDPEQLIQIAEAIAFCIGYSLPK